MSVGKILRERIINIRKSRGLSSRRLAELMNTSQSRISYVESGRSRVTDSFLDSFAQALNISCTDLLACDLNASRIFEMNLLEYERRLQLALHIDVFEAFLFPTCVQSIDYTRAVFHQTAYFRRDEHFSDRDFERIKNRIKNKFKEITYRAIVAEGCLYNTIGSPAIMAEQIENILSTTNNVRILPYGISTLLGTSLSIFDSESIVDRDYAAYSFNDNPIVIDYAQKSFESLWELCADVEASRLLLARALKMHNNHDSPIWTIDD